MDLEVTDQSLVEGVLVQWVLSQGLVERAQDQHLVEEEKDYRYQCRVVDYQDSEEKGQAMESQRQVEEEMGSTRGEEKDHLVEGLEVHPMEAVYHLCPHLPDRNLTLHRSDQR